MEQELGLRPDRHPFQKRAADRKLREEAERQKREEEAVNTKEAKQRDHLDEKRQGNAEFSMFLLKGILGDTLSKTESISSDILKLRREIIDIKTSIAKRILDQDATAKSFGAEFGLLFAEYLEITAKTLVRISNLQMVSNELIYQFVGKLAKGIERTEFGNPLTEAEKLEAEQEDFGVMHAAERVVIPEPDPGEPNFTMDDDDGKETNTEG